MSLLSTKKNVSWFYDYEQDDLQANGRLFLKVYEQSRDLKRPFSKLETCFFDRLCSNLSNQLLQPPAVWDWQEVDNLPNSVSVFDQIAKKQIRKPLNKFPIRLSGLLYDNKGMYEGSLQSLIIKAINLSEGYFRIYDNEEIQEFYLNRIASFEAETAQ